MVDIHINPVDMASGTFPISANLGPIMITPQVGYLFYRTGTGPNNTDMAYRKTTDGGFTWTDQIVIAGTGHNQIWCMRAVPDFATLGLSSGTKIHVAFGCEDTDEIVYFAFDTNTDTISSGPTQIVSFTKAAAVVSLNWSKYMLDFTQSRAKGGQTMLMVAWHHKPSDNSSKRSGTQTSKDDGATWATRSTLADAAMGLDGQSDRYLIFPGNEADEYDMVSFYWDDSSNDLSWKTFDDSAGTWTEQIVVETNHMIAEGLIGSLNMAGMVRHFDSTIIVAWRESQSGTDFIMRIRGWDTIAGGGFVRTSVWGLETGSHDGCGLHIDQNADDIYVNWNGNVGEIATTMNHYYAVSRDGAVTWESRVRFNANLGARNREAWGFGSSGPGGVRTLYGWAQNLIPVFTNASNSLVLADPSILSVAPAIGPTVGGQTVTITGTAFDDALGVSFGGASATIVSSAAAQIVVTTPPGAVGLVDVIVLTIYGSVTLSNGYQYILVMSPAIAGAGGGGSGREFTAYISPDGRVHEFHTPHRIGRFIISQSGWGTPPIEYITQRGPFQHGETVKDFFLRPRVVQLLVRENLCNRDEWWASRADLLNDIRPNRQATATATAPGQLRRVKSSGEVRDLDVFIAEGPRFEPRVAGTWDEWSWQEVLRFIAHNPIEFDPTEVIASFTITLPSSLVFPITFPITFGGTIVETLLVDYIGTWESLPRILITGPIDSPRIDNTTTGEKLQFAFDVPAGRELEIDLAYGVKTVQEGPPGGPYTINRIGTLSSDSDLATFHLAPTPEAPQVTGQPAPTARNTITLTGRGVSGGTAVQVRYFTRFFGI